MRTLSEASRAALAAVLARLADTRRDARHGACRERHLLAVGRDARQALAHGRAELRHERVDAALPRGLAVAVHLAAHLKGRALQQAVLEDLHGARHGADLALQMRPRHRDVQVSVGEPARGDRQVPHGPGEVDHGDHERAGQDRNGDQADDDRHRAHAQHPGLGPLLGELDQQRGVGPVARRREVRPIDRRLRRLGPPTGADGCAREGGDAVVGRGVTQALGGRPAHDAPLRVDQRGPCTSGSPGRLASTAVCAAASPFATAAAMIGTTTCIRLTCFVAKPDRMAPPPWTQAQATHRASTSAPTLAITRMMERWNVRHS